MRYITKANNTWHDDIELWDGNEPNIANSIDVFEPNEKVKFTGLYDSIGQEIYADNRNKIGFKL